MDLVKMENNLPQAVVLLKAMANENRLHILCLLHDKELSVGELCLLLPLSQSALSQHLVWLRRDGLVKTRKQSQAVYYSLHNSEVKAMIEQLHKLYSV
ncbi:winged helix-turn-helix transcriptional regulator [Vibrio sp. S17_S38]|uniref:ArsR/SmtB family transcription factor n=1 Tax=Vibrio sp. S17_S38 TaxID=2720229 RepID=UPI001681A53E|nr:metalloregulator ArsR/SmtB family transcription factor [Vibrio sp. S17_S38]MBD1572816.1 winged helix-turn-helix transcriptional regulator [Vibrio sp. S17_S38]